VVRTGRLLQSLLVTLGLSGCAPAKADPYAGLDKLKDHIGRVHGDKP
jgi:hypothetical protein